MMSVPLPPKKEVALALLERSSVHVHLDPRAPGVVVPAWFKKQPQLVLQVGLNMPVPIPDLRLDEDSITENADHDILPWNIPTAAYLHGFDSTSSAVSPLNADLSGLAISFR